MIKKTKTTTNDRVEGCFFGILIISIMAFLITGLPYMIENRPVPSAAQLGYLTIFVFAFQQTIFKWFMVQFLAGVVFAILGSDKTAKFFSHLWFVEKPRNIKLSLLFWLILTCIGCLNYWVTKGFGY